MLLVVMNMTPVPRHEYAIGVPIAGQWKEIFNSDARMYGGTDVGNGGVVETEPMPMNWQEQEPAADAAAAGDDYPQGGTGGRRPPGRS